MDQFVWRRVVKEHSWRKLDQQRRPNSRRQWAVAILVIMIVGAWTLDSFHVQYVPAPLQEKIVDQLDDLCGNVRLGTWIAQSARTLARQNPIDGSPFTSASIMLFGIVCGAGFLLMMSESMLRRSKQY